MLTSCVTLGKTLPLEPMFPQIKSKPLQVVLPRTALSKLHYITAFSIPRSLNMGGCQATTGPTAPRADITNLSLPPSPRSPDSLSSLIPLSLGSIKTGWGMKSIRHGCKAGPSHTWDGETKEHLLGPFTVTPSSPLPAALVSTLKSAVSRMRMPLGCRPRPLARQAFGLQAANTVLTSIQPFIR